MTIAAAVAPPRFIVAVRRRSRIPIAFCSVVDAIGLLEPGDPGVDEQAVDIGTLEAGVLERKIDSLGREADRSRMIQIFAHPGLSEPGDSAFTS